MNCLVDTHIFLWSIFSPAKLSKKVKGTLLDPKAVVFLSAVTFWEISLKYQLGKLDLKGIVPERLPSTAKEAGFLIENLDFDTASSFYKLPRIKNRDPFDRMLVWQAINKDWYLLTKDSGLEGYKKYGLKTIWQKSRPIFEWDKKDSVHVYLEEELK